MRSLDGYEDRGDTMSKESRADYYEKVFDRLEKTRKHTWNWAAFFWGFSWMGYRKIYLPCVAFSFIYAIFAYGALVGASILFVKTMSISWGLLALFLILFLGKRIGLGYFGNALYYWSVKKRIRKGYHLLEKHRPTSIMSIISPLIMWIADAISHEMQSGKLVGDEANAETIHAYLDPNKKNHWAVKTGNVLVCVFCCLYFFLSVIIGINQKLAEKDNLLNTPVISDEIDYLSR
jgi:hypothetical protein